MKKLVGITCAHQFKDGMATRNYVNKTYIVAIASAGALAVLLPVGDPADASAYLDRVDGLLLPGGIDVDPKFYGQQNHPNLGDRDESQDKFEIAIVRGAWNRRMPIMAICRGIQLLNVALGGTLIQDIPAQAPSELVHRQNAPRPEATHEMLVDPSSRLFELSGDRMAVNSFHHQSIDLVAPPLRVVARARDGIVEAVESDEHPLLIALQCHPEEMAVCDPVSQALFRRFVSWL